MSTIVLRATKGSALTHAEGDANFTNLNTDKAELSDLASTAPNKGASLIGFDLTNQTVEAGATQQVAGITALKAITPVANRTVYLKYHTTAGDGGHGNFRAVTGAAPGTYTNNNGTTIVPTGGDGSAAWLRVYSGAVNVRWFGAQGDGATDDTTEVQAAIDYVQSVGGGVVFFPLGVYVTTSTLTITDHNTKLEGQGATSFTGNSNWRQFSVSTIKWNTAGGTVVQIKTPASNAQLIQNCGIKNILVDCVALNGTSRADIGVEILSLRGGIFEQVTVYRPAIKAWNVDIGTGFTSLTDSSDTQGIVFKQCVSQMIWTSAGTEHGWVLGDTNVDTGTGNVSLCRFEQCEASVYNGVGFKLHGCDSNTFDGIRCYKHSLGTGYGVEFHGGSVPNKRARSNFVYGFLGNAPIRSVTGTEQAESNIIIGYSLENIATLPEPVNDANPIWYVTDDGACVLGATTEQIVNDASTSPGPTTILTRYSASPSNIDVLGTNVYNGYNSVGVKVTYADLQVDLVDPTSTSEDGGFAWRTAVSGSIGRRMTLRQGLAVGGTATDPGTGNINAANNYYSAGTKVVGARETGWTAGTGTANKGAFATYAGQTVSAAYVQAEAQATDNAAKANSQRIKALEDALRTHGLIN